MARVLVCDDATFMRMTLIRILKEGGHETVGAAVRSVTDQLLPVAINSRADAASRRSLEGLS